MLKNKLDFKGMLEALKDSFYLRWLKKNRNMLLICVIISTFLCILTYPGIMYSDSYNRISMASSLKMAINAFEDGYQYLTDTSCWLTILPSFFMLWSKEIVGSVVLYTFVQGFLMFLISYGFSIKMSNHRHRIWNIICISLTPIIWAYSIYYEASVGCIIAIMVMLLVIYQYDKLTNKFDKFISILLLIFASLICFGYRANAFTIIPALLLIILIKYWKKLKGLILIGCVGAGLCLTMIIPEALHINTMSSYAASFVWEMVSTIQSMDNNQRIKYNDYLDDIFGEGKTQAAINSSSFTGEKANIYSLFNSISASDISAPGNSNKILNKYLELMRKEPKVFFQTKWEFISHTLGFNVALDFKEYDYNRFNQMNEFGFNDSEQRKAFVGFNASYIRYMKLYRTPWMMFIIALLLLIIERVINRENKESINLKEASFLIALFYYGAYVVNTQSFEFRYFFPSWLLLILIIISSFADIMSKCKRGKEMLIIASCGLTIFGFVGGYHTYTQEGNALGLQVASEGKELYRDENHRVYYLDDMLYFVANPQADTQYKYFLHFFPVEGDIINQDFYFQDHDVVTSWWSDDIAIVRLPKQALKSIAFGQYYENKRFWETTIPIDSFIKCPQVIKVCDYTDQDWIKGYHKSENCFLLQDLGISNYLLKGKDLQLLDGSVVRVVEVKEVGNYLQIYTDKKIEDANNREIKVVK